MSMEGFVGPGMGVVNGMPTGQSQGVCSMSGDATATTTTTTVVITTIIATKTTTATNIAILRLVFSSSLSKNR